MKTPVEINFALEKCFQAVERRTLKTLYLENYSLNLLTPRPPKLTREEALQYARDVHNVISDLPLFYEDNPNFTQDYKTATSEKDLKELIEDVTGVEDAWWALEEKHQQTKAELESFRALEKSSMECPSTPFCAVFINFKGFKEFLAWKRNPRHRDSVYKENLARWRALGKLIAESLCLETLYIRNNYLKILDEKSFAAFYKGVSQSMSITTIDGIEEFKAEHQKKLQKILDSNQKVKKDLAVHFPAPLQTLIIHYAHTKEYDGTLSWQCDSPTRFDDDLPAPRRQRKQCSIS